MHYTVIISPHPRQEDSRDALYDARLEDQETILCASRQPFLVAARKMLASGIAGANDTLFMRHAGSDIVALSAKVGVAARLTVQESADRPPRLVKWRPYTVKVSARINEDRVPEGMTPLPMQTRIREATLTR
jgi:hypothetical protein